MKNYKRIMAIAMSSMMIFSLAACSKTKTEDSTSTTTTTTTDKSTERVSASTTETSWFNQALDEYISSNLGQKYFVTTDVYNSKSGITAENALKKASATITVCVNADDVDANTASDFSDTFARYLATNVAEGSIDFTIYRIPSDLYVKTLDTNYNTIIKESKSEDDYSKYSFSYTGIGDGIYNTDESTTTEVQVEEDTSEDITEDVTESTTEDTTTEETSTTTE